MPSKPFNIATRAFVKKGDAMEFFRAMLNRYRPGDIVNAADSSDLAALLKHHSEYPTKLGGGVAQFEVIVNIFKTQSFEIVRVDGSRDDFSYKHCITPKRA
jgi:hypothetical protein